MARTFADLDPVTRAATLDFKRRIAPIFGDRLKKLMVYGSRARGDHRPDSDLDLAVFVDKPEQNGVYDERLFDAGAAVAMGHGIFYPAAIVLDSALLDHPERSIHRLLLRSVLHDGVSA